MGIEPVLYKLIQMLREAGVHIPDADLTTPNIVEVDMPNPVVVCEVFKRFAYLKFDCNYFKEGECKCVDWEDGSLLFECGVFGSEKDTFYFAFRRAFFITIYCDNNDSKAQLSTTGEAFPYQDVITCEILFEPVEQLQRFKTTVFSDPPYGTSVGIFFNKIECLDAYRIPIEQYQPRKLVLFHSD